MALLTFTDSETGEVTKYKNFTYSYMDEERTSWHGLAADAYTIGGVCDDEIMERDIDEQILNLKEQAERMDGYLDPTELNIIQSSSAPSNG